MVEGDPVSRVVTERSIAKHPEIAGLEIGRSQQQGRRIRRVDPVEIHPATQGVTPGSSIEQTAKWARAEYLTDALEQSLGTHAALFRRQNDTRTAVRF